MDSHPSRPTIEYPCEWKFRVLGEAESRLREVIAAVLSDRPHIVTTGNVSSGGKYRSIEAATEVLTEEDRDRIFGALASSEGVRAVV
jgi:putative lipoic acid-binding regulatory protein